ncbi:serine/threonine-protein kinase PknH/PknJ [Mycobacterium colombiense]
MPLIDGQTFAGYTIIRLLGFGGMGEVYLAQHPRLPRRDALKLLPHEWSGDAEFRSRFNREADLASTLWNPHIVGVHDRGEQDGRLWISMDFVDGLDAARLLADRYPGGMPVEEVARVVTAVASALDYAHKQDLLHRDVKPGNIMISHLDDEDGQRILLTDFGIARNVNDISGLTKTNMTVGTVAYCAPEQLLGEDVDGRADQYSLAATAFHLLTGSQLFPSSNPAVVISRHLNVPPPALADRRPTLAKFDQVLAIGLAKRPEDRFKRCSDFARAFSEQINSDGLPTLLAPTAPAPRPRPTVDAAHPHDGPAAPGKRWKRPRVAVVAVVAVALLATVGIIGYLRHQPSTISQPPTISTIAPTTTATSAPLVAAAELDGLLLSPDQINTAMGTTGMTVAGTYTTMDDPSNFTADKADKACLPVIWSAQAPAYAASGFSAYLGKWLHEPAEFADFVHAAHQDVVLFSSAHDAEAFFTASTQSWLACSNRQLTLNVRAGKPAQVWTVGPVSNTNGILSATTNIAPPYRWDRCQRALAVANNVVIDVNTCSKNQADSQSDAAVDIAHQIAAKVPAA